MHTPTSRTALPVVFVDFDGTITRHDTTDAILRAYAHPRWLEIEQEWVAGRIGSRECLAAQMALVDATREDVDALLEGIEIDEGLVPLLDICASHHVPLHIVSDGFDYCIGRLLSRPSLSLSSRLEGVQIVSSHLEAEGRQWSASFASFGSSCVHGCATCKPAAMERLNVTGGPLVFVGDGLSDRYAATAADLVFAKGSLASFCDSRAVSYTPYDRLAAVALRLEDLFQSETAFERMRSNL